VNAPWHNRYQALLLLVFFLFLIVSCADAPYPKDLILQHIPTVAVVGSLLTTGQWLALSNRSFTLFLAFMMLHVLGARYLYSYVPYDAWTTWMFGTSISDWFSFERNHYDRFVHFCYGLLMTSPIREVMVRRLNVRSSWSYYLAVESIVVTSVLYELGEWVVAMTFAPDWADRYLGQQGDLWDAHKDMALAMAGSILSASAAALWNRRGGKIGAAE